MNPQKIVLNIDSDLAARQARGRVLNSAGYQSIDLENSAQATEFFSARRPDAVLLSTRIPDYEEICRKLKTGERPSPPVLLLADKNNADEVAESLADGFLSEPHSGAELLTYLKLLLRLGETEPLSSVGGKADENADERHRAYDRLQESEAQLRAVFETTSVGVTLVEAFTGRLLKVNNAYAALIGYTHAELAGMTFSELTHPEDRQADWEFYSRLARGETTHYEFEKRYICKSGAIIWVYITANLIRDDSGKPVRTVGLVHDITARKRAEHALRRSEAEYRLLFESAATGNAEIELPGGRFLRVNRKYCEMTGYTAEELSGMTFLDITHRDDWERGRESALLLYSGKQEWYETEKRYLHKNGSIVWVHLTVSYHPETADRPVRALGSVHDITARKHAEKGLRDSEARFRVLAEEMPHLVWETNPNGESTYENARWVRYTGLNHEQTRNLGWLAAVHPDDMSLMSETWAEALRTGMEYELYCRLLSASDNCYRWFQVKGVPIRDEAGNIDHWVGTYTDVQKQREAEDKLMESERWFRQVVESLPQLVWTCRPEGPCDYLSPQWLLYTGVAEEAQLDFGWLNQIHPDDRDAVIKEWRAAVNREDRFAVEFRIRRHDGIYHWFHTKAVPLKNEAGGIIKWFGTNTDIQSLKRAESALAESRDRERQRASELTALMEAAPAALWIAHDPECRRITGNRESYQLLKMPPGQNVSASDPDSLPLRNFHEYRNGVPVPLEELPIQAAAKSGIEVRDAELTLKFDDGEERHIIGNAAPLFDNKKQVRGVVSAFVDVTSLKLAQEALREADHRKNEFLAMLGHELRNPLTPISMVAQIMQEEGMDKATYRWACDLLNRNVAVITRHVNDLLDVSRITRGLITLQKEAVDLGDLLRDAKDSCRNLIDYKQQSFECRMPDQRIILEADPVRLTQVFSNLLTNSAKYTDEGGHLEIIVQAGPDDVQVIFKDNGMGLPPELQPYIFDLFTQGERGLDRSQGGLGIGLTLVKKLVELHGGSIIAQSEGINRGAEFVVKLPRIINQSLPGQKLTPEAEAGRMPPLRILLIDDNPGVADSMAAWLRNEGHEVKAAHAGLEGVKQTQCWQPDIVMLDIGLPDLDGYRVAEKLRQLPSGRRLHIVALSGYAPVKDDAGHTADNFNSYLIKPPNINELKTLIAGYRKLKLVN